MDDGVFLSFPFNPILFTELGVEGLQITPLEDKPLEGRIR